MVKKVGIACFLVLGTIFLPTTTILFFGMMPTIAAFVIDKSVGKSKTLCVAFMNFAGCFPFLMEFWMESSQRTMETALPVIANVENIIIIYLLAAGGYAIDIAVTGITASLIVQRANARIKSIKSKQKKLAEDWGDKVTGKYVLDEYGFPVHTAEQRTKL
jgi:hypothetical protein